MADCWNDVPTLGVLGKVTDCQCHHGAPWVLVLFGKTTDNHLRSLGAVSSSLFLWQPALWFFC